jgi:hypothetical protein
MIYETDTDLLAIWNGSAWRQLASATKTGSVLQIVTGTTNTQTSTGSTTYSDAGLSATITPQSTSNKILVTAQINWYNTGFSKSVFNLVRGSTQINETMNAGGDANNLDGSIFLTCLDSPATTSSITYKVQFKVQGGATYLRASATAACNIFLTEVSA